MAKKNPFAKMKGKAKGDMASDMKMGKGGLKKDMAQDKAMFKKKKK